MARQWIKTDFTGVRYREHPTRTVGKKPNKVRPERYYAIRYRLDGKDKEEGLGWESETLVKYKGKKGEWDFRPMTAEDARDILKKLLESQRTGGPQTYAEQKEEAAGKRKADTRRRKEQEREAVTLAEYWDQSYSPWAKATKAAAFDKEESHWRMWINPNLGAIPIRQIGVEQWDALVKSLSKAGLSQRTREYVTGTLRRIVKHARERRIAVETPPTGKMIGCTTPKDNRRLRVLTGAELHALLEEIKARDLNAWRFALFLAVTGCRVSEAASLYWRNVDLEAGRAVFVDTKNGASRPIPLPPELVKVLAETDTGQGDALLLPAASGRPYQEAPSAFRSAVDALKLNENRPPRERFSAHNLRHGAATKYAQSLNLRDLMTLLGWKVPAMALRYTHANEDAQRKALDGMDRLVSGKEGKVIRMERRAKGEAEA